MKRVPSCHLVAPIASLCLVLGGCGEDPPPPPPPVTPEATVEPTPVVAPEPVEVPRFAGVVWVRGEPRGVVVMPAEQARHQTNYVVTETDGTFEVVETLDHQVRGRTWRSTAGTAGSRRVSWRSADGALERVDQVVDDGTKVVREDGEGHRLDAACVWVTRELDPKGRTLAETCIGQTGAALLDREGVARRTYELDVLGRRVRISFSAESGRPIRPLGTPYMGLRHVYDDGGRLIQRLRVDAAGQPIGDGGFASREWDHDDEGRLVEQRFEGPDGKSVTGPEGWATESRRYEETDEGLQITTETTGVDGHPTRRAGSAVARAVEVRDPGGRLLSRAVFDAVGNPAVDGEAQAHRGVHGYDAEGRRVGSRWFGVGGRPALHAVRGVHREQRAYDADGREVSLTNLDGDGAPVTGPEGWARRTQRWSDAGKIQVIAFEDPAGQPTGRSEDGAAKLYHHYDDRGRLDQVATSGPDGAAIATTGSFARHVWEHDKDGRVVTEAWFDLLENRVVNTLRGCARETITYNEQGEERERRCLDTEGAPAVATGWKAYGIRWGRDDQGRVTRETFVGRKGLPTIGEQGYAAMLTTRDMRGEVVGRSVLDTDGRPGFTSEGIAGWRWKRDAQGRVVSEQTIDTLGNLVGDVAGIAEVRTSRSDRTTKIRHYGHDGQLTRGGDGVAGRDYRHDAYGRVVGETVVDVSGLPARDPRTGCATVETDRDATGEPITRRCLGPLGQASLGTGGWAIQRLGRDARGHVTAVTLFDTARAPVVGAEGWSRKVEMFGPRGLLARRRFEGLDGLPVLRARSFDRDRMGRIVRESILGPAGLPVMGPEGWATRHMTYDLAGRLVSEGYAGPEGRVTRKQTVRTRYDVAGRVAETRILDATGKLTAGPQGWAVERRTYDSLNRLIGLRFFDEAETPGVRGRAHVGERHIRDPMGRLLERHAMAAEGTPVDGFGHGERRWSIERQRFDAYGRRTWRSVHDSGDRPAVGSDDLHATSWTWDERGRLHVQERWLSPGQAAPGGWGRQIHGYNALGQLLTIDYQDAMGQPAQVWNGVNRVRFNYQPDGRMAAMGWFGRGEVPMDANICFPGTYCGKRPVHVARYHYQGPGDAVRMTLHDRRGRLRKTLDCARGQCF